MSGRPISPSALSRAWAVLNKFRKSVFVKNVLIVMSGTAAAQALSYALSPVISRLFSPADFGVFGSFTALLMVVTAGITLDYSMAIMLPKEEDKALGLFFVSSLATIGIGALALVACVLFPGTVRSTIEAPQAWILVLLVIGIVASGINQTCQAWCVRAKAFKQTSASQVVRSLSTNGTQMALGVMKGGAPALIFASVLGEVLASLNLARIVLRDLARIPRQLSWRRVRDLAREYRDFPLYSASMNVVNAISLNLPVFLLNRYFGIELAGAYAFTMRILSAPMGLVQKALRQVLYQKACETQNEGGRLLPLFLKFTGGLFLMALLPALVLSLWGPRLFAWIFGSQWRMAGVFAQSLVLWLAFVFCNLPAVLFSRVVRAQRQMFFFDITVLVLRTAALVVGGLYLTAPSTVLLYSLAGTAMNIVYITVIYLILKRREGRISWKEVLTDLKEGPV